MNQKKDGDKFFEKIESEELEFFTPKSHIAKGTSDRDTLRSNLFQYVSEHYNDYPSIDEIKEPINNRNESVHEKQIKERASQYKERAILNDSDISIKRIKREAHELSKQFMYKDGEIKAWREIITKQKKGDIQTTNALLKNTKPIERGRKKIQEESTKGDNPAYSKKRTFSESIDLIKSFKNKEKLKTGQSRKREFSEVGIIREKNIQRLRNTQRDNEQTHKQVERQKDTNKRNIHEEMSIQKEYKEKENAKEDTTMQYYDYLKLVYLYSKMYFFKNKMQFFSIHLFYEEKNLKHFILWIDSLFLKGKYIEVLHLLETHKKLWVLQYKKRTRRSSYKKTKKQTFERKKQKMKKKYLKDQKKIERKEPNLNNDLLLRKIDQTKRKKKRKKINKREECSLRINMPFVFTKDINYVCTSINKKKRQKKIKKKSKMYKRKRKSICCIFYLAFVKILCLLKLKNRNCLMKSVQFINKINKKILLHVNSNYLLELIIKLYELLGMYHYSLYYCILLFLKFPLNPTIILKLFSFSILSPRDEIYLILLAEYPKKFKWLKYFLFFILYSVNQQYTKHHSFQRVLFLIKNVVRKRKKKNMGSSKKQLENIGESSFPKKHLYQEQGIIIDLNKSTTLKHRESSSYLKKEKEEEEDEESPEQWFDTKEEWGRKTVRRMYAYNNEVETKKINKKNTERMNTLYKRNIRNICEQKETTRFPKSNHTTYMNFSLESMILDYSSDELYKKNKMAKYDMYKKIFLYCSIYRKVTLYDVFIYITKNKFSKYFPPFFLYSKLYIIANIKRSFYEKDYPICYSLCQLLLNEHIYHDSIITFFVNASYLLDRIGCIKNLSEELKKHNKHFGVLFCNATLLLHFKQINKAIHIYKYIIDSYDTTFSDLYLLSLYNLIYSLQLTQRAHTIINICKQFNTLFFNNTYSFVLLSYYYLLNNLPYKSYSCLEKSFERSQLQPENFFILSQIALHLRRFKEYITFSELALFFSLKKKDIRNFVFTKIYEKHIQNIPKYLVLYNFQIKHDIKPNEKDIRITERFLNYCYFENLIKSFMAYSINSYTKEHMMYLLFGENLCNVALYFFPNHFNFQFYLKYIRNHKKNF